MSQERDRHSSRSSSHHEFLIKLRGIPYKSTKDDVKKFLQRKVNRSMSSVSMARRSPFSFSASLSRGCRPFIQREWQFVGRMSR